MSTPAIDGMIADLWPNLAAAQDAHHAAHGVYFQCLWTHEAAPDTDAAPDLQGITPAGQAEVPTDWLPQLIRARLSVDTYGQPDGWTLTAQAIVDGQTVLRRCDCGIDGTRSCEWQVPQVAPD